MTPNMISACEAHILNYMSANHPGIPVLMSGQAVPADESVYVRFWVLASEDTFQTSVADQSKSRNVGVLQADVYGPKDRGAGETGDLAKSIADAFFRRPIEVLGEGWVVCRDPSIKDMGDDEEEHRQMMRVPYKYDFTFVSS